MILDQIKTELEEFDNPITIVDNFEFSQKDTISRIYLYYNSKYETGEIDEDGDKKYFFNINRNPCDIATKGIDFDTKDITIQTASGGTPLMTWLLEKDLKFWLKDKNFGRILNRIFYELPIFGSVVLKIIKGGLYFVDLRNFVVEQTADSLDKADYIIEIHNYSPVEFRKVANARGWQHIEDTIAEARKSDNPFIRVYERYGEDPEDNYTFKRIIIADVGEDIEENGEVIPHTGYILDSEEISELPYREFHWEKIPGRWLGRGRVEMLFDPQIRVNEISNQQVKSSYWSTLRLWQTRDEGFGRNLLTDVHNGDVLNVESELTQIDMADRNLAYYGQEIARWLGNRDELAMSYDVIRGERLPSGTPLGSAQLAAGMVSAYFDQIRENIALDIKKLLYDVVIPQFMKENNAEHILRLTGEDLDKINELIVNQKARDALFDYIDREGRIPFRDEFEIIKTAIAERVKRGKEKLLKIGKNFYKDLKYKIDIVITGEAINTGIKAANLFAALQAITATPDLLTNPVKRKFFNRWLEQGGLNPVDFQAEIPAELPAPVQVKPAGGGVSRPASIAPAGAKIEKTI